MIIAYIGDGKGKTSAAIGSAIRAAGAGERVAFIQFDKGLADNDECYNERNILKRIKLIDFFSTGASRFQPDKKFRFSNTTSDFLEAIRALEISREAIKSNKYFLIILDEILSCVETNLITKEDLKDIIETYKQNPSGHLILTGRCSNSELLKDCDLITEMKQIKHYFDQTKQTIRGIDF